MNLKKESAWLLESRAILVMAEAYGESSNEKILYLPYLYGAGICGALIRTTRSIAQHIRN